MITLRIEIGTSLSRVLNTTERVGITDLGDPYVEIIVKTLNVN